MKTWIRRSVTLIAAVVLTGSMLAPSAGAASVRWTRDVGKRLEAVAVDARENSYVVGTTEVARRNTWGALIAKFGPDGRKVWSRIYLPSGSFGAFGSAVTIAPDGSIVWGGKVNGGCEGGGWFVQRISPSGRTMWTRSQDGWRRCEVATALTDIVVGRSGIVTSMYDHGCCGDTAADAFLQAFDMRGAMSWTRDVEPAGIWRGFDETALSLALGGLGNLYLGGWAATERDPGELSVTGSVFLQKLSSGGGLIWQRRVEPSWWRETDVAVAARGDAVLLTSKHGRKRAAYLTRFTSGGDRTWTTRWSDDPRFSTVPHDLSIDGDGVAWVVGGRADPGNDHANAFVRTFAPGGGVRSALVLDPTGSLDGSGVDTWADGRAVAVGSNSQVARDHGRIWALRA